MLTDSFKHIVFVEGLINGSSQYSLENLYYLFNGWVEPKIFSNFESECKPTFL